MTTKYKRFIFLTYLLYDCSKKLFINFIKLFIHPLITRLLVPRYIYQINQINLVTVSDLDRIDLVSLFFMRIRSVFDNFWRRNAG